MFPILSTADLPRALRFYRDLLGGEVTFQFPAEGEPAYVSLQLGPSALGVGVQQREQGPPATAPDDPVAVDRFALWVYVDDCDAALAHLRDHGVAVTQEAADQPWGERIAFVTDPDGNRVIIASRA